MSVADIIIEVETARSGIVVELETARTGIVVSSGTDEGSFSIVFYTADEGKLLTADADELLVSG